MIFLGLLFKKEIEKEILEKSNVGLQNAANNFQWNLIEGLSHFENMQIISALPVGSYPSYYKKLILKTEYWELSSRIKGIEIGSLNIPIIKQYIRYKRVKGILKNMISHDQVKEEIIIYSTYLPYLKAVSKLKREYTKITMVATDLPEYYDLSTTNAVKRIIRKINNFFIYKYLSRVDRFIILTEDMKIPLRINNRPYIVMEGIANIESVGTGEIKYSKEIDLKKIILYTGTLNYKFGILNLLAAFKLIINKDYELWICGSGEAEKEIIENMSIDKRIKYYGYVNKNELKKIQDKATLLINPRDNSGTYTKYSFPSKTIEYMLSGKPVAMFKLEGIPKEYDDFLCYFENSSPEYMSERIINLCQLSFQERLEIGKRAREFIVKKKNNVYQSERIIRLIKNEGN